jgi:hypothetical protein
MKDVSIWVGIRHWADNDGIEVIDVHNKDVLHIFEGPDRESTSEV